jgi:hypothetical protein
MLFRLTSGRRDGSSITLLTLSHIMICMIEHSSKERADASLSTIGFNTMINMVVNSVEH